MKELKPNDGGVQVVHHRGDDHVLPPSPKHTTTDKEIRDEQTLKKVEPNEPLELIPLDPSHPEVTARIGSGMAPKIRHTIQQLITEHQDVFTLNYEDIHGIDPQIMQHYLSVDPKAKGVRQKRRNFSAKNNVGITAEVDRRCFGEKVKWQIENVRQLHRLK